MKVIENSCCKISCSKIFELFELYWRRTARYCNEYLEKIFRKIKIPIFEKIKVVLTETNSTDCSTEQYIYRGLLSSKLNFYLDQVSKG